MYQAPQIDFLGMFLAAQNARAQREQMNMARERQDMEMQQFREQKAQQAQLGEAKKQYFSGGDSKLLQMMSPELYGQYEQQKRDAAKFDAEQRMGAIDENKKKELLAAGYQNALANASPEQRPAIEQKVFELTQAGMLPRVEVTGPDSSKQNIADIAGSADATNQIYGEKKDPKTTNDMVEFQSISGLSPGDPRWGPLFAKYQEKMATIRTPKTTIDMGLTQKTQGAIQMDERRRNRAVALLGDIKSKFGADPQGKPLSLDRFNTAESDLKDMYTKYKKWKSETGQADPAAEADLNEQISFNAKMSQLATLAGGTVDEDGIHLPGGMTIAKGMGNDAKLAALEDYLAIENNVDSSMAAPPSRPGAAPAQKAPPAKASPGQPAPIDLEILQSLNPGGN